VGTHIESPGIIYQKGGSCKISIGKDPLNLNFYPETLLELLRGSEINYSWEENVQISIWTKYIFIASFGLVTATYNKTLGEILENEALSELTKSIMKETYEISKYLKIPLPLNIIDLSFSKATTFPFETKTSFQRDIEAKGKINESDLFGGTLIRLSEKLNITIDNTKNTYKKLVNNLN